MRVNQVIAVVLLSLQAVGCAKWSPARIPSPGMQADAEALLPEPKLRITLRSGERFVLYRPTVYADSVRGQVWLANEATWADSAVAYRDAQEFQVRRPDHASAAVALGGVAVFAGLVFLAVRCMSLTGVQSDC